jgi:putative DNA primase/helicase
MAEFDEIFGQRPTEEEEQEQEDFALREAQRDRVIDAELRRAAFAHLREQEVPSNSELTRIIQRHVHFKCLEDTKELYVYNEETDVYDLRGDIVAEQALHHHCRDIRTRDVNEVLAKLRALNYVKRDAFDDEPDWLHCKDGWLNWKTGEFDGFNMHRLSLRKIGAKYNPKATCRPIIEHLYNTFQDPTDVPLFLEWLAYNLFWTNKNLQKEMLMVGEPSCGKSKTLDIMTAFLGGENVSAVTYQQLSTHRFAKAQLFGKLANIYADISHVKVEDLEAFKAIATGDEIVAEHKRSQLFKFRPTAKLTFSCNIPPKPPINVDDSFYRRWLLVKCAWRSHDYFTGKVRTKDNNILNKLLTEENLSGLLNLVIISGKRLLRKGRFCKTIPTDQLREDYDQLSNSVVLWLNTCTQQDAASVVDTEEAYKAYRAFCHATKRTERKKEWFGRELVKQGVAHVQLGSERKWVYSGIKLLTGMTSYSPFSNQKTQQSIDSDTCELTDFTADKTEVSQAA